MGRSPGFMFYPGDYLRDTQNLSENTQVAYDRIMCEHMRNICDDMNIITVSEKQIKFFMKRLSDDEKEELFIMLTKKDNGFQIEWVAESIANYVSYCNSRKKNRLNSDKKDKKTYVKHMESEKEDEKEDINVRENKFKEKILEFSKKYSNELLINFFNHWSQHGENDRKMLFEKQKSFELSKRLITWSNNDKNFNKKIKIDKTNINSQW